MFAATTKSFAVVTHPPCHGLDLRYEEINVATSLKGNQLLVEMVATGICQLEIHLSSQKDVLGTNSRPRILGHEGAGYVRAVGAKIDKFNVGDAVILSYDYCKTCHFCLKGLPAYCKEFYRLNMVDDCEETFKTKDTPPKPISGMFFGQSSFSALSVVSENAAVNVTGLIKDREELKILGPLGCGFQTGAGAVMITGSAGPADVVVVAGIGAVGLGAVMAARIAGCKQIISVDRVSSRLSIAQQVGATAILNTAEQQDLGSSIINIVRNDCISLIM